MSAAMKRAFPIGSQWTAFNHGYDRTHGVIGEMGLRTVMAHKSKELQFAREDGRVATLGYVKPGDIEVDSDGEVHISTNGKLLLSYTPVIPS